LWATGDGTLEGGEIAWPGVVCSKFRHEKTIENQCVIRR